MKRVILGGAAEFLVMLVNYVIGFVTLFVIYEVVRILLD